MWWEFTTFAHSAWVHCTRTVLGNIKSAINGTYRAVRKHVDRTLPEFERRMARPEPATSCLDLQHNIVLRNLG